MVTKKLKENAVYSDIEKNNLFLKEKKKYTVADFNKVKKDGWGNVDARFIVICSAVKYNAKICRKLLSSNFLTDCEIKDTII